jgi:hypothetical protein
MLIHCLYIILLLKLQILTIQHTTLFIILQYEIS